MNKITNLTMKAGFILSLLLAVVMCTGFKNLDKNPTIFKGFTLDKSGLLDVETSGGWIHVEGTDGNQVEVRAFIEKNGRLLSPDDPEIDEILEDFDFIINKDGETINVFAKNRQNGILWKNISISFYVSVPHNISCHLRTSGGSINLSGVNGPQDLNTSGGRIDLANIVGNTMAHTSGGGIHIQNIQGKMDVSTSGGGIDVIDGTGNIKAHTSGGGIRLENIHGEADVHTSGGSVRISGIANSVKATTSGGGIHVDIYELSKELYLDTSGGGIDAVIPGGLGLDLDLKANNVNIDLQNFSGSMKDGRAVGSMNGGGIPVYMHTSGGNVNVDFR